MDFTHVNSAKKVLREKVAKNILEILASYAASNFLFLFTRDKSWLLYTYMHITFEPCGHSVVKMLTKFNSPHTPPRKQWQLCSLIGQGRI
jgi:hypothetical protein